MSFESIKTLLIATIDRTFPTLGARIIAVLVAVMLAVLAVQTRIVQSLLPFAFFFTCIISLTKHIASRKQPPRRQVMRSIVGFARRLRRAFAVGWDVELLHLTVLMIGFVLLIFQICYPPTFPSLAAWFRCLAALFVLAGAIDAVRVAVAMAKFSLARWAGRAFYAGVGAFSIWAGDVFAEKLIAQATGLDPEHFVATERLIHWLVTPLIGLGVIVGALSILSLTVYVVVIAGSMLAQQIRALASGVPHLTLPCKKASIAYRLTYGKNRMKGTPTRFFQWEGTVLMMRPLAVSVAGVTILWCLVQLQNLPMAKLAPIVREMVVMIEFNVGQKCGNTVIAEPIAHLEDGKMVVAIKIENDWKLEPDICEVEKRPATRP